MLNFFTIEVEILHLIFGVISTRVYLNKVGLDFLNLIIIPNVQAVGMQSTRIISP